LPGIRHSSTTEGRRTEGEGKWGQSCLKSMMAEKSRRGRPPHDDVLTPAEWRIVHAVKHGLSNREIARRRGISLDAVKYHVANATAKLGVAGRQGLKQWHRAPRGSALKEANMKESVTLGALGQIARTVRDIKQSEAWYRDVLGLPHLYTFGNLAFFDCGGTRLMLSQESKAPAAESMLYWRVGDIVAAHAALKSRGIEFMNAPHMIHKHADGVEEWLAAFKDIEGRALALISQVAPR
jgi:DNA-binding CsgD family transcriptional regulator/catechol 2,3-dioxygenase-like lactoylglutathione lyase family enzyme